LKKKSITGTRVNEDFDKERTILKNIYQSHAGIVKWIDEWETKDEKYMAMDYYPDGSLIDFASNVLRKDKDKKNKDSSFVYNEMNKLMTNDNLSPRFIVIKSIFTQMVSVVQHLHNQLKICHMDLSLENFLVTIKDEDPLKPIVLLADFGLALDFSSQTETDVKKQFMHDIRMGKMNYQSPECYNCQFIKDKDKDFQCNYDCRLNDIYCLGICLFVLLFDDFPYRNPKDRNAIELLKNGGMMPFLKRRHLLHLINEETIDLLDHLITYSSKRWNFDQILRHSYFHH